jgi:hypothetical protein
VALVADPMQAIAEDEAAAIISATIAPAVRRRRWVVALILFSKTIFRMTPRPPTCHL